MGIFDWFRSKPSTPTHDVVITRGPKSVHAAPGTEERTFLEHASAVLECEVDATDLSKDLREGYRCDEMDLFELTQIAEDVWCAQLMPSSFGTDTAARHLERFRTLDDIVRAAKTSK